MINWRTTLFGVGAGALNMFANGIEWQQVALSTGLAFFGLLSKDYSNSGTGESGKL